MKQIARATLSLFLVLFVWHMAVRLHLADAEFFPSPLDIFTELGKLLFKDQLIHEILASARRLLAGTLISIPSAILASILCLHSKIVESILRPVIAFTYPLPKVAIIPLLMLMFGIGDGFKIAVIALGMFYIIFISLYTAMLRLKNSSLFDVVKIYKIKKKDYFFQFLLKGIWLDFLVSVKLALGYGLTLVVVSEFSMSKNGIGNFIWKSWDQFKVIDMYAGVFFLCIIGFIIYGVLDFLISRTAKYY